MILNLKISFFIFYFGLEMKFAYGVSSRGENADTINSNIHIRIRIMRLLIFGICIHVYKVIIRHPYIR